MKHIKYFFRGLLFIFTIFSVIFFPSLLLIFFGYPPHEALKLGFTGIIMSITLTFMVLGIYSLGKDFYEEE